MSRRGAARWWRPTTRTRPPLRARQRRMYSEQQFEQAFDVAYECGRIAERKRWRDDLLEVADAAGVSPVGDKIADEVLGDGTENVGDEVERWLRDQ